MNADQLLYERGWVYDVPDTALNIPPRTLKERVIKRSRPFIVFSGWEPNRDSSWPVVTGFFTSTSDEFASEWDVHFKKGEAGMTEECWAYIPMLQPLAKTKLLRKRGEVTVAQMNEIVARFMDYTNIY